MPSARLVNAIACRTYAVLWGAFAISSVFASINVLQFAHGLPIMYEIAASNLLAAVICGVLAAFTWIRSMIAVSISFALCVLGASSEFWNHADGDATHPIIAASAILVFGVLLAAAIATRRHASLPSSATAS